MRYAFVAAFVFAVFMLGVSLSQRQGVYAVFFACVALLSYREVWR